MPELPECETVVRKIRPHIWGCEITNFIVAEGSSPEATSEQMEGHTVRHVSRIGKYIVFKLDHGYLVSHLRMTGQWFFSSKDLPAPTTDKHFRWAFALKGHDGEFCGYLWFKDVRKFGTLVWTESLYNYLPVSKLGPDGLSLGEPKQLFGILQRAKKTRRPIKNFLLDQRVIAGCGNIYSCEALFASKISPLTPTRELTTEQLTSLCIGLCQMFKHSIDLGGSSISDHAGGQYQTHHQVYGRSKEPCNACGTQIKRITQAGRVTFYCPSCQGEEENEFF
jgi:formamidopyrimidine-DNA glycosylase